MRHGMRIENGYDNSSAAPIVPNPAHIMLTKRSHYDATALGCYFCMDVVAPGDSTRDRTLDQQCTVTRPGLSMMAAALSIELLVSALQHPLGAWAPAVTDSMTTTAFDAAHSGDSSSVTTTPLGTIPHQMRMFLSRFQLVQPIGERFGRCTACSTAIVEKYRQVDDQAREQFLVTVFNDPRYLETLTGLDEMHAQSESADVWELSDEDDAEDCAVSDAR